jgi:EmrB/QacA subfamily drug resistance transporter
MDPAPAAPRRGLAFTGVLVGLLLAALDGTVVATALPHILDELQGFDLYFLPNAAFMLCQTVFMPVWGRLSDQHGRSRFHLAALLILMAGSALCGLSRSMEALCAARAVQGLGAGGVMSLSFTMVADLFDLEQRARMQGAISSVWGIAALVGPFLGEWVTKTLSWPWIFYLNIPVGLVSAVLVQNSWPPRAPGPARKTDFPGAALLALTSASLLGFFGSAGNLGWGSTPALGSIGAAAFFGLLLVLAERRHPDPFLAYDLYKIRLFWTGALTGVFGMMCMFTAIMHVPLLVAGEMGRSLQTGGLMLTCMMLPWMICSGATRVLLARFSYRALAAVGMLVAGGAYVVLSRLDHPPASLAPVICAMLLLGTGLGLTVAPLLIAAQNAVPKDRLGAATSLTQFTRSMGAGLGLAVMGAIMVAAFGGKEPEGIVRFRTRFDPEALRALTEPLSVGLRHVFAAGIVAAALGFLSALAIPAGRAAELKRS